MSDPYFALSLVKDGKDYVAKNGDRLTYTYTNKRGNDVYALPNGKTKEINDENIAYQNSTSSSGCSARFRSKVRLW
jgi:hypothetical protein